jgi:hypothetical protein
MESIAKQGLSEEQIRDKEARYALPAVKETVMMLAKEFGVSAQSPIMALTKLVRRSQPRQLRVYLKEIADITESLSEEAKEVSKIERAEIAAAYIRSIDADNQCYQYSKEFDLQLGSIVREGLNSAGIIVNVAGWKPRPIPVLRIGDSVQLRKQISPHTPFIMDLVPSQAQKARQQQAPVPLRVSPTRSQAFTGISYKSDGVKATAL